MNQLNNYLVIVICAILFSGCATARMSIPVFNENLEQGQFEQAKKFAEKQIGRKNTDNALLWNLQAGSVTRDLQDFRLSNYYFDRAEKSFKNYDLRLASSKALQTGLGVILNDSAMPYVGKMYDRIMVNTYKALNCAVMGDMEHARVEFNRALSRQNDAKRFFEDQISKMQDQIAKDNSKQGLGSEVDETVNNSELDQSIRQKYKNLDKFQTFSDFVNPFSTYVAGLFFWLQGDADKGAEILKQAYGMNSNNGAIRSDFLRADKKEQPDNELWIVFENGLSLEREETRIDVPVFIASDQLTYVGTAFPILIERPEAYPSLVIEANGKFEVTEKIADMDGIISAEFKKELPMMIFREVSRVVFKTIFQYKMQEQYGMGIGLLSGIYQLATTAADIRMWTALPKNFQVAHVKIPEDRKIILKSDSLEILTVQVPADCKNAILYVRIVTSNVRPIYSFIKFP